MVFRIVKMTFKPDTIDDFKVVFNESAEHIRSFPGNMGLQLLQGKENKTIFFTYSIWENDTALQTYLNSPLFEKTWAKTKVLFCGKPEAWSTDLLWKAFPAG
ncbi:MAG: antibiotic biosynthesis monooxygenase [Bacteroidetes bacterium]|nr:antibiotic biosynthesis monooxygenase [Bacteroidota bacterium]